MIAVTGATGQLGRLVIHSLLDRGVEPQEIVAAVRNPQKANDLGLNDLGIEVRKADYNQPDTLETAFADIGRLLLISSSEVGNRLDQHRNVVRAARRAGVDLIAYTSGPYADRSPIKLLTDHRGTEEMIRAAGIPFVFLRNGWYMENYTGTIGQALERGAVMGSAGDGKISAATRNDLADAAAVVIGGNGHENAIYELGGDDAFTMTDFADEISKQTGQDIVYNDLPVDEYAQALVKAGLPEGYANILADSDAAAAAGWLYIDTGDLSRLIGRPTTTLQDAVAEALEQQVETHDERA